MCDANGLLGPAVTGAALAPGTAAKRVMMANPAQKQDAPARDEWGIFDPRQAGVPAVMQALREQATIDPGLVNQSRAAASAPAPQGQPATAAQSVPKVSATSNAGAMYTLESPVQCPQCEQEIRTLRVLRVLRTQASFTSTLPRKGYVVVCPECDRVLSAELSGLV